MASFDVGISGPILIACILGLIIWSIVSSTRYLKFEDMNEGFETTMFDPVSNPTILVPYICIGLLIMALAYGYMNPRK